MPTKYPKLWPGTHPIGEAMVRAMQRREAPYQQAAGPGFLASKSGAFQDVKSGSEAPAIIIGDNSGAWRVADSHNGPFKDWNLLLSCDDPAFTEYEGTFVNTVAFGFGRARFATMADYTDPSQPDVWRTNLALSGRRSGSNSVVRAVNTESEFGPDYRVPVVTRYSAGGEDVVMTGWAAGLWTLSGDINRLLRAIKTGAGGFVASTADMYYEGTPANQDDFAFPSATVCSVLPGVLISAHNSYTTIGGTTDPYPFLARSVDAGGSWDGKRLFRADLGGLEDEPFASGAGTPSFATMFANGGIVRTSSGLVTMVARMPYPNRYGFCVYRISESPIGMTYITTPLVGSNFSSTTPHWSAPYVVLAIGAAIVVQPLMRTNTNAYPPPPLRLYVSEDDGATWSYTEFPWEAYYTGYVFDMGAGALGVVAYTTTVNDPTRRYRLYSSSDLGQTWQRRATVLRNGPVPDIYEPTGLSTTNQGLIRYVTGVALRDKFGKETAPTPSAPWMTDYRFPPPWE